jgi:DNA processing protein
LNTYPPENAVLYERIVREGRGAVISELPAEAPPNAENFPPRNRIIAGMSLGIVVVEANLQSGSLITARLAAADYGREVFALPGRVDSPASAGTHHLIKSAAAHLVESAEDVLGHLGDLGRLLAQASAAKEPGNAIARVDGMKKADAVRAGTLFGEAAPARKEAVALTSVQEKILAAIGSNAASVDEIVETTSLKPQVIVAELTLLQIQGHIIRSMGNRFATQKRGDPT